MSALGPDRSQVALRAIQAQARYLFTPQEFARATGREPGSAAVRMALQRLARQGHVVNATKRPARWLIIPPEQSHYGAPPVDWWLDDCLSDQEPNYYVALLSAARHWGSSHYAVQTTQVMIGKPRSSLAVGRIRVDFYVKERLAETPVTRVRTQVSRWRVSTREATLLDLVRHQTAIGGIEAVARIARDFAKDLDLDGLTLALDALGQVAAAQRLGFVLDRLGQTRAAKSVAAWLDGRRRAVQLLETGPVDRMKHALMQDPRWAVEYTTDQMALFKELQ